jgi:Zinc finger, ZZ type
MCATPLLSIHAGVSCNMCKTMPIIGDRYKCTQCKKYDLCSNCESKGLVSDNHKDSHIMWKYKQPLIVVHTNVSCDGCHMNPIMGDRYQCTICHNYDLCTKCEEGGKLTLTHQANHPMTKHKIVHSSIVHAGVPVPTPVIATPRHGFRSAGMKCVKE